RYALRVSRRRSGTTSLHPTYSYREDTSWLSTSARTASTRPPPPTLVSGSICSIRATAIRRPRPHHRRQSRRRQQIRSNQTLNHPESKHIVANDKPKNVISVADLDDISENPAPIKVPLKGGGFITFPDVFDMPIEDAETFFREV